MNAQGIVFLNRQRPMVNITPSGEFELLITALDRISARQAELWRIRYVGQRAKDLWETCSAILVPGQPIHVHTKSMRVYSNGAPLIEAEADIISIAARSHLDEGGEA